jgi:hypothetical protein
MKMSSWRSITITIITTAIIGDMAMRGMAMRDMGRASSWYPDIVVIMITIIITTTIITASTAATIEGRASSDQRKQGLKGPVFLSGAFQVGGQIIVAR